MGQVEPIDLRSDTVTAPSAGMRQAIANAVVGDDVYGEDPTVNKLQEQVADLLGTQAALFVPSGSMANQIAIKAHTQPGDEILVGQEAHTWLFESGAAAALSGVQPCIIGSDGHFSDEDITAAFKQDDHHHAPTRLVSIENTHNMAGGLVWPPAKVHAVLARAAELSLATHLDGARLWNAAVYCGESERTLARGFDSVSVCLSKGLGAPVGSLLCGTKSFIHRAHRIRKMLGGGMRQAGILAAAGLYALDHNRTRLAEDHENACGLAIRLANTSGLHVDVERTHTNIVMVDIVRPNLSGLVLQDRLQTRGVLCFSVGPKRIRLVTHLQTSKAQCDTAADLIEQAVAAA